MDRTFLYIFEYFCPLVVDFKSPIWIFIDLIYAFCLFPVFESFKDYVATEQLDGDNKYDAGEHGLQVRLHSDWI